MIPVSADTIESSKRKFYANLWLVKAVVYVRISADLANDGHGVKQQADECLALADRLGWTVVETYRDNDISAYSGKIRPGYEKMLTAIESGRAKAIIAWHTDRLHRSLTELERFADVCRRNDVRVETCKAGHIDFSTASGQLVAGMLAVAAKHEVAHMVERQKSSHTRRAIEGRYRGGRRPFGFEADGVTLRPLEASAIHDATDRVLRGESLRSIVRAWNLQGLETSTGTRWSSSTLRQTLLRPRNAALVEHHGEIVGPAEWEAIVSEDDWRAVKAIFSDPSRRSKHTRERRWIGSNVFICGVCGRALSVGVTSRGVRQYRCLEGAHLSRALEPVDEYVSELAVLRLSRPDAGLILEPDDDIDIPTLQVERDKLQARLNELSIMFADSVIDGSQLKSGTSRLRSMMTDIDEKLASARGVSPIANLVLSAGDVVEAWTSLSPDLAGKVISELMTVTILPVPRGERNKPFNPEYVGIKWKVGH